MDSEHIPDPTIIIAREHLEEVVEDLKKFDRLAIDIESNGFYAYREKVCLLQLSSPKDDYIVDPIAIADLSSLSPLMSDPAIEKVFHAGEYDVLCLKRDYGFTFENVFDTMIANRILGVKELGLAAAIEKNFGLKLSKKYQRDDWGRRPLSPAQLRYAQMDTHFLMRLADIQKEQLREKRRLEDAAEAFAELAGVEPSRKEFDPTGYWKIAGREVLSDAQMCCLRELYVFREEQAQARDKAHFRVMPEELMLRLARVMPASMGELAQVKGMTPYLLNRYGHDLLKALQRGRESEPVGEQPRHPKQRRDARELKLFEDLRQWRKGQAIAEDVEPVVVMSSDALKEIARLTILGQGDPLAPLSPLKRGRYGEALMKLVASVCRSS